MGATSRFGLNRGLAELVTLVLVVAVFSGGAAPVVAEAPVAPSTTVRCGGSACSDGGLISLDQAIAFGALSA